MKHVMALGITLVTVTGIVAVAGPQPRAMGAGAGQSPRKSISATIAQVGWIEGTWVGNDTGVTVEERWTPPAGGAMLAVSRTLKNGRMAGFEFLRIVERDGGLVYVAQPGGKPPTDFVLTTLAESSATFENPGHDFPKLIRYTKRTDGSLEARVGDGGGQGRSLRIQEDAMTYVYRSLTAVHPGIVVAARTARPIASATTSAAIAPRAVSDTSFVNMPVETART
jgi:hypothetical protein